jgi:small subunit ribosomal protein S1
MSWTKRVQHPSEVLRKGDDVEVVVLGVDPENKRISLGLKQTTDDPWSEIALRFSPGVESEGRIVRLLEDGVVVDLGDDIEGFVPRSQISVPANRELTDMLGEGQTMGLRVLECDVANRRIVLTVTEMPEAPPPPPPAEPSDDDAEGEGAEGGAGEAEATKPAATADAGAEPEAEAAPVAEAAAEPEAETESAAAES